MKKLMLHEIDSECLAKGIAIGCGLGTIIGAVSEQVVFFFSLGGVIGILISLGYSITKKLLNN